MIVESFPFKEIAALGASSALGLFAYVGLKLLHFLKTERASYLEHLDSHSARADARAELFASTVISIVKQSNQLSKELSEACHAVQIDCSTAIAANTQALIDLRKEFERHKGCQHAK